MNRQTHSSLFQPYSVLQEGNRWFNIFSVFLFSTNPGACWSVNLPEPQGVTFCPAQINSSHPIFSTILTLFIFINPPLERPVLGGKEKNSPLLPFLCIVLSREPVRKEPSDQSPRTGALWLIINRNEQTPLSHVPAPPMQCCCTTRSPSQQMAHVLTQFFPAKSTEPQWQQNYRTAWSLNYPAAMRRAFWIALLLFP